MVVYQHKVYLIFGGVILFNMGEKANEKIQLSSLRNVQIPNDVSCFLKVDDTISKQIFCAKSKSPSGIL